MRIIIFLLIFLFSISLDFARVFHIKENLDYDSLILKIKENPSNTHYLSYLGNYYEKNKKWDEAVRLYKNCLDLEPDNSFFYIQLSKNYNRSGRPDLGLSIMSNAVQFFDKNCDVLSEYAGLEYDMGMFRTALQAYEKVLIMDKDKNEPYTYNGIAKCCRELKEYEKSAVFFQKSLQARQDCWTYYEFGKLFFETGKFEQSIWALKKAKALSYNQDKDALELICKKLAASYYSYGMELKDSGRKDEAKKIFKIIIEDWDYKKTAYCEKAEFWIKRL